MKRTTTRIFLLVVGICLVTASDASAQSIILGGTADVNSRAAGARAPGNMVITGVARAQDAAAAARASGRITATSSTTMGTLELFRIDAVQILSDQLIEFTIFFGNLLLERAGFPSLLFDLSSLIPPPDDGTTGGTDTTADPTGDGTDTTGTGDTGRNPRRSVRG